MPMNIRFARALLLGCAFLTVISGAAIAADAKAAAPVNPATTASETYAPGLGDFMTAYVQPHHIKLWLAGSSGYWKLAAYEADELGETFDDISNYQPVWKNRPVAQLVKAMIEPALKKLDAAITGKNAANFKSAYATLTAACNSCHLATQHEFVQIRVPTANPFSDQDFAASQR
jgi:hypothetical protein